MAVLSQVTEVLSGALNRSVSDNFSKVVVKLYRENATKTAFAEATKAFGLSEAAARSVYVFINDNIGRLDGELASEAPVSVSKPAEKQIKKVVEKKPKKAPLMFDMEDDDLLGPPGLGSGSSEKPKKIVFKKMKKEDARRIKEVEPRVPVTTTHQESINPEDKDEARKRSSPSGTENDNGSSGHEIKRENGPKNDNGMKKDDDSITDVDSTDPADAIFESLSDVENDREWYTLEESATAAVDQYLDLENDYRPKKAPKRDNRTGGGFNASGEYVDYDHGEQLQHRFPITSHFIVPPFLKGSEHYLTLSIDQSRTSRSVGPSVDPIKDPESELAVAARNGSSLIRERKEKQERASRARDRVGDEKEKEKAEKEKEEKEKEQNEDFEENDYTFETIQKQRKALPAYQVREELLKVIAENQIIVVIGETGSGKTTQIAQFLAESGYTKSLDRDGARLQVACTQPRRVAAMSVAKRVSEEMGCRLGEDVGYSIRFEDRTNARKTRIKYMTEGILLREMLEDPNLESYSCVIMDEAHERSLNTDVLLGLFKQLLRRRRDLKLIVTSATMNAGRFVSFFGTAPQFFIPGRTFPVEVFYSKSQCADYVETAVKQVVTIHLGNKRGDGDILVFMTGQEDIEATCELIYEKLALLENPPPLDVYPIYSTLPADVQRRIFRKQSSERRKVVVATNIAETSLTVDGIRYVVDCGLVKMKLFNPKLGMDALQMVPIAYANAQQRSGRAGRTAPGLAYRLYTEMAASPDQMFVQPIPEIQRTNLSSVMLLLKSLKVADVMRFAFLDSPPLDLLSCSLYELWAMGALDHHGDMTSLGEKMTAFPMEPTLAKLIILSCQKDFSCSLEIITIVSMLSVPSVFYRPKERADEADAMREKFMVAGSDHLTLLNVYTQWEQRAQAKNSTGSKLAAWSGRNFLHHKSLLRAQEVRRQLLAIMSKLKFPVTKARTDTDIRRCICAAYFHQSAVLEKMGGGKGSAQYANLRQIYMKMYLHPTSALVGGTDLSPQYVVYDELVLTKREYMQCATAVEPEWLLQYGHVFYGVSSSVKKDLESRGINVVDPKELESQMSESVAEAKAAVAEAPKPKKMKIKKF